MTAPAFGSPVEPFGLGRAFTDRLAPASPAAGAGLTQKLDPTYLWRPLSVRFSLSTDANVANRFVSVDYCDPEGNVYLRNAPGLVITASTTGQIFDFNYQRAVAEWASGTDIMSPLADLFLPAGWQIKLTIGSVQAGDQISSIFMLFQKWLTGSSEDLGGATGLHATPAGF